MDTTALIHAFAMDGKGGGRRISLEEVERWQPGDALIWAHLDLGVDGVREWLSERAGIDPINAEALSSEDPRPRVLTVRNTLLAVLRGVNFNPGADPEDMVSVRAWIEEGRMFTLRNRRIMAVQDVAQALEEGHGPASPGDFVVDLVHCILDRTATIVENLGDAVDEVEDRVVDEAARELRSELAGLRRQAIVLRRYLAPQRDVLTRLPLERLSWISDLDRTRLREEGERITRFVEDIDADRDRAAVTQEELTSRLAEQTNRTMYVLSVVTAIFLPLGLLTGLLGIYVGGIPGAETPWAFTAVCIGLIGLAAILVAVLRKLRWL